MIAKSFNYHCFEQHIVNWHGKILILELYQDGDIWSDDEVWGTCIFDLKENKFIDLFGVYVDTRFDQVITSLDYYLGDSSEWKSLDDNNFSYNDDKVIEYYNECIKNITELYSHYNCNFVIQEI